MEISRIDLPVRDVRSRKEKVESWPVLHFSSWASYELSQGGHMMLGGHNISQRQAWMSTFSEFWTRYEPLDPTHPIFHSTLEKGLVVPYMVHGDEGRGRQKHPLLTISFQCMVSHYGTHVLNMSGSPGCMT